MNVNLIVKYLKNLSFREVLEKAHSDISPGLEVVRLGDSKHLNALNTNYSYGGLHRVFQKAFKKLPVEDKDIRKALILGFGAGSVAAIIREELKIPCHITGVDADPVVLSLAGKYFNISRFDNLDLLEEDAMAFIESCTTMFDLIVVDVYVDFEVPEQCESQEFVDELYRCLSPGGIILFNKLVYNHEAGVQAGVLEQKFSNLRGAMSVIKIRESVLNKIIVFEKER